MFYNANTFANVSHVIEREVSDRKHFPNTLCFTLNHVCTA